MEKARRRQVPAFGEWNYCYYYDETPAAAVAMAVAAECYDPEPEACSDVWFRYSPPPRKPTPKKTRRPDQGDVARGEKGGRRGARAMDAGGLRRASNKAAGSRVVRPVDEDLYQVPPPEFSSRRPRRKRSLWMGCLGLNSCVA